MALDALRDNASRLHLAWARVRDSLWFIPSVGVLSAMLLATLAVLVPTPDTSNRFARLWFYTGGADGARQMLSAIAASLITVTGTVFSVTIVALQLASSQFTPRVLGTFVADRVNQLVLGIFIGTFTYSLLVLRTIRSEADTRDALVPHVAVTLALLLLLVSIGALIVFIDHAAQSIRASVVLQREADRGRARVAELFPERVGEPAGARPPSPPQIPAGEPAAIVADVAGYLQSVDASALWHVAGPPLLMRMEVHVGAFVIPGKPLVSVWPAERARDPAVVSAVRTTFVIGPERTSEQDVEFGIIAIGDIAIRALSPSINDPTTAMHAIDRLTEILADFGTRRRPDRVRESPDGTVRLIALDTSFERAVGLAFDQIRHFGAANPTIGKRLLESLADLAHVVPEEDRAVITSQAHAVLRAARRAVEDPEELAQIERLAGALPAPRGAGAADMRA